MINFLKKASILLIILFISISMLTIAFYSEAFNSVTIAGYTFSNFLPKRININYSYIMWLGTYSLFFCLYILVHKQEEVKKTKEKDTETKDEAPKKVIEKAKKSSDYENIDPEMERKIIVNFLRVLQDKGRFIDYAMGDMAHFTETQLGAASRVVQLGCKEVLNTYFDITPLFHGEEGSEVRLDKDYESTQYKLIGSVSDEPPYEGKVTHNGWRTSKAEIRLPKNSHLEIIAPIEIEVKNNKNN